VSFAYCNMENTNVTGNLLIGRLYFPSKSVIVFSPEDATTFTPIIGDFSARSFTIPVICAEAVDDNKRLKKTRYIIFIVIYLRELARSIYYPVA